MLVGNENNQKFLEDIVVTKGFGHGYLFIGPEGVGKTSFATAFAKSIICSADKKPCGTCDQCLLFESGNHPDFMLYDDEGTLGVDEIRELTKFLGLKPYQADHKVAVVAHAEKMSIQAANSFLKTLEEPSDHTIIILTAENLNNLLPTVISRLQAVKFLPLAQKDLARLFPEKTDEESSRIISLAGGKVGLAKVIAADADLYENYSKVARDFLLTVSVGTVTQRLKFAETLAKEKTGLKLTLDLLEVAARQQLIEPGDERQALKNISILDKLSMAREMLSKNVNKQLVLESLLLTGVEV